MANPRRLWNRRRGPVILPPELLAFLQRQQRQRGMLPFLPLLAQAPAKLGPQEELEALIRGLPPAPKPAPAPQPAPAPRPAPPDRVQPGNALRRYQEERDAAMEELRRQGLPRR